MNTKSVIATLAVAAALLLAGCSSESQFPEPTGKGTFRGINAISNSPSVFFRIEESAPDSIVFRAASSNRRFDDFEYNFNFDVSVPEETELRRVATATQKIDANQDYTFVLTGNINSPNVLTWISSEREFDEGQEITEIRLAHLADSLGTVDVYFLAEGTAPVLGEARGTYSFGDVLPPFDVDSGSYTVAVTAAGDPSTILYESVLGGYAIGASMIVAVFDGTVNDTVPYVARAISKTAAGASFTLPDVNSRSTVQFVQGSEFIDTADIYLDEDLTNRIVAGLPFGGIEPPIALDNTSSTFYFTPADSTATVLLEQAVVLNQGLKYDFVTIGSGDSALSLAFQRDRQPIDLYATVSSISTITTEGQAVIEIYFVPPGEGIEDAFPDSFAGAALTPDVEQLLPGQYDMIFAVTDENDVTTQLAGPISLDVANGDVLRYVLFSTADPNVIDVQVLP